MRVLVVEDEELLAEAVATGLRREGMAVDTALDGQAAVEAVDLQRYDVVILDRDLPLLHGDQVCRHIVERWGGVTGVLMLTAASSTHELVRGLRLGADDYLGKPFAFTELVARVNALARRAGPVRPPVLERSGIRLDPWDRSVHKDGMLVRLTAKEFGVLRVLLEADGAVVSAEELLARAWDENADPFTASMRVIIARLRRKLGADSIVTTVGAGYQVPW
ncbi:MAG: response regulator transcription factor [Angustibacter sp.]